MDEGFWSLPQRKPALSKGLSARSKTAPMNRRIPEHPVIPLGFKTPVPGGGTLPEHYGCWVDPFVPLSIAATVTKRMRLGYNRIRQEKSDRWTKASPTASLKDKRSIRPALLARTHSTIRVLIELSARPHILA
jgi:hypothetical protein